MNILCSLICSAVSSNPFCVMDITTVINLPSVPQQSSFCVVLVLQGDIGDVGRQVIVGLRVLDSDAKEIWKTNQKMAVIMGKDQPLRFCLASLTIKPTVNFQQYGEYIVIVDIDDETVRELPLDIRPVQV